MSGRTDDAIEARAEKDAVFAVAYGLLKISTSLDRLTKEVKMLGVGESYNEGGFGAIEWLAMKITEAAETIAAAIPQPDE